MICPVLVYLFCESKNLAQGGSVVGIVGREMFFTIFPRKELVEERYLLCGMVVQVRPHPPIYLCFCSFSVRLQQDNQTLQQQYHAEAAQQKEEIGKLKEQLDSVRRRLIVVLS